MAQNMGLKKFSIIEFGVAGGNGLINIEQHVEEIKKEFSIDCEVYGFDSGEGMPASDDYRDLLYLWAEGFYKMDREALEKRLSISKLIIGNVRQTCKTFHDKFKPAPIGCVFFDLDYYTSTLAAFEIFNIGPDSRLPRIPCHFDDISGTNKFLGELGAIEEFNRHNDSIKIAQHHMLAELRRVPMPWNHEIYCVHDFTHPAYNTCFREDGRLALKN